MASLSRIADARYIRINRESARKVAAPCARTAASTAALSSPFAAQPIEHFGDQLADLAELRLAEAARRAGRACRAGRPR